MSLVCLPLEQKIYTQHDGKTLCITSGLLNHSNQYKQNDEIMVLLEAKWFLNFCKCQLQSQMSLLKIREVTFKLTVNLNEVNGYFLRTPLKKNTQKTPEVRNCFSISQSSQVKKELSGVFSTNKFLDNIVNVNIKCIFLIVACQSTTYHYCVECQVFFTIACRSNTFHYNMKEFLANIPK